MNNQAPKWLVEATLQGLAGNRQSYRASFKREQAWLSKMRGYAAKGSKRAAKVVEAFLGTYPALESEPRREPLTSEQRRIRRNRRKAGK